MKNLSQENKIKIAIVGILLVILLFIIFMYINNKDEASSINKSDKYFEIVNDYQLFFFASNNIDKFIIELAGGTNLYKTNLLYKEYIKTKKITTSNVNDFFGTYVEEDRFEAKNILNYNLSDNVTIYKLNGNIVRENINEIKIIDENISYILFIDYYNQTMAIYPIDNNFNENKFIKNLDKNFSIDKNENNSYQGGYIINKDSICLMYLNNYLKKAYQNIEEAYKLTDNFKTLSEYKKFIDENSLTPTIISCELIQNNDGSNRVYTIYDSNNNKYKFYENSIMNYTVTIN